MIILDALFPPAPEQLVRDCQAVGASGCWLYVLRQAADGTPLGTGSCSPAHASALQAAGLLAPGIVVPGNVPPDPADAIRAARAFGITPVLAADFETFSEPPPAWEDALEAAAAAAGYRELSYGPASELGVYDPGEPGWLARWLQTGVLDPIPALPAGQLAWQFVHDVVINGSTYDVSVVDPSLFSGGDDMLPQEHDLLVAAEKRTAQLWNLLVYGDTGDVGDGQHFPLVQAAPAPIDVEQLAAALAPHLPPAVDPAAVASAVLAELGQRLTQAAGKP